MDRERDEFKEKRTKEAKKRGKTRRGLSLDHIGLSKLVRSLLPLSSAKKTQKGRNERKKERKERQRGREREKEREREREP